MILTESHNVCPTIYADHVTSMYLTEWSENYSIIITHSGVPGFRHGRKMKLHPKKLLESDY